MKCCVVWIEKDELLVCGRKLSAGDSMLGHAGRAEINRGGVAAVDSSTATSCATRARLHAFSARASCMRAKDERLRVGVRRRLEYWREGWWGRDADEWTRKLS